jgi:sugar phosphate isomerase/epimerase
MSDISLDDYISEFDRKICYLHLYDVSATGGHYPPGSGDVPEKDWLLLLRWMQDTEFQGPVVFEVHPLPECDDQSAIDTVIGSRNYLETLSNTL